jgi:hypothetical protein
LWHSESLLSTCSFLQSSCQPLASAFFQLLLMLPEIIMILCYPSGRRIPVPAPFSNLLPMPASLQSFPFSLDVQVQGAVCIRYLARRQGSS